MSNLIRNSISSALMVLVGAPLNEANEAALADLARLFWYSKSCIKTELKLFSDNFHPSEIEMRRVGYLLERLCRFTCVSNERASETLEAIAPLMHKFRNEPVNATAKGRMDSLASYWGLTEGLGIKAQIILPFQSRSYRFGNDFAINFDGEGKINTDTSTQKSN